MHHMIKEILEESREDQLSPLKVSLIPIGDPTVIHMSLGIIQKY